jgi:hypothetical protein
MGIVGTLRIDPGEGNVLAVEFTPAKPQLQAYRATTRRGDSLQLLLERLGVAAGHHIRIQAASGTWQREVTILPSAAIQRVIAARGR